MIASFGCGVILMEAWSFFLGAETISLSPLFFFLVLNQKKYSRSHNHKHPCTIKMAEAQIVVETAVVDQTPAPVANPEPAPAPAVEPEQVMDIVDLPKTDVLPPPEQVCSIQSAQPVAEAPAPAAEVQQPAAMVLEVPQPKKKRAKRSLPFCGMYPPSVARVRKAVAVLNGDAPRICKWDIDKLAKARRISVGPAVRNLFTFEDCAVINDLGDVRFGGCVLASQMGPFAANESVKIIDWMPSVSAALLSKTAKVSDTVVLEISPASVSQTPLKVL
jgi:hypothetical protein